MNRRFFIMAVPILLAACSSQYHPGSQLAGRAVDPHYRKLYAATTNERYPVPAVNLQQIDPKFLRREVKFTEPYAPGTIVVKTSEHYAYFVLPGGKAMRYGVGVARSHYANFRGQAVVGRKAEWPHWTPTLNMMRTQPERYGKLGAGLPSGPTNPLGARALYLYRNGKDTYFRLHGTIEPWSIGTDVSSGCIRFLNQDIIDLYSRAKVGARVVVVS